MTANETVTAEAGSLDGSPRISTSWFEPSAASVAVVRRVVARHLDQVAAACRNAVVLIASELATNAVVHAGTPYLVEVHLGEVVRIEVTDSGPGVPLVSHDPPDAASGRGLFIVSAMSCRWGVDRVDGSKVVWAEVDQSVPD